MVAAEAWEQHCSRNASIMTELFYGQLKSKVVCDTCASESVRFDAFNMLSLPLPMESYVCVELKGNTHTHTYTWTCLMANNILQIRIKNHGDKCLQKIKKYTRIKELPFVPHLTESQSFIIKVHPYLIRRMK